MLPLETPMQDYRLYFFDRYGHIANAVTLECADVAEAIQEAERCRDGRAMELWRRAELIRRFEVVPLPAEDRRITDEAFADCRSEAEIAHAALDQALQVTKGELGNVQLLDRSNRTSLEIVSQRGFKAAFLDCFRTVSVSDPSACGRALLLRKSVVIEDVLKDDGFRPFLDVALEAGFRSVQSTPLLSSGGAVWGVLSTHAATPGRPSERQMSALQVIGSAAADALVRVRSRLVPLQTAADLAP
jgi:hypothetical protein